MKVKSKFKRKNWLNLIYLLLLLILNINLVCFLGCLSPPEPPVKDQPESTGQYEYRISDNLTILFSNPPEDTMIDNHLINLIYKSADDVDNGLLPEHTTLDVCLYDFNQELVIDALEYAIRKNVHVRFVGDLEDDAPNDIVRSSTYDSNKGYELIADALDDHPIYSISDKRRDNFPTDSYFDPPGASTGTTDFILVNEDGIMHNKYFLITTAQGKYVYTGSANCTDNGFIRNNNNSLIIKDDTIYEIYQQHFEYLLTEDKDNGYARSGTPPQPLTGHLVDGIPIDVYFSYPSEIPINRIEDIVDQVSLAQFTLHFMIFTFTHDSLEDTIIEKKVGHSEFEVLGLFDQFQQNTNQYVMDALSNVGIECRLDGNNNNDPDGTGGGMLHSKIMIIDPENAATASVITGSFNWTLAASNDISKTDAAPAGLPYLNDENFMILQSSEVAAAYEEEFQRRWETGTLYIP